MSFDFVENFTLQLPDFSKSDIDFSESFNSRHGLIIEVAAIHEGLTANYNHYSALELEKALQSWVEPYPKPIILNHDLNTEPIGRVMAAKMDKESDGSAFVRLQIAITDPVAAQKVIDKRYLTGSVGGRAAKAVCSISGDDLATEDDSGRPRMPKFKRGKVYKGKLAYIDMQDISFKEYSFVNQPADQKSGVRSTKVQDGKAEISDSDGWIAKSAAFILSMDLQESESYISNANSLLSNEDSEKNNSEETHSMKDVNKEEDILAVAEGLSEDLSNIAASSSEEPSDAADEKVAEEASEEKAEEVSEESASTDSEEKNSADDSEEADVQTVDSENAEKPEESSVETTDENQEEAEEVDQLSDNKEGVEQDVDPLKARIQLLEEENAKLKGALHRTLVERVVDTKIGLGYESVDDREKLIEEHAARTASSLADSLRDLAKAPAKTGKRVSNFAGMPEVTSEAEVTESEDNVLTLDKEEETSKPGSSVDSFEQVLVDALMGRRKL